MSTPESDTTQFRLRVYLPTGYTCTLQLYGKTTFAEVRNQCWDKKSKDFGCPKSEARFRLYTTELFFNDHQTISYFVSIYPSFEGLGTIDRYSLLLESPSERGDKVLRNCMKVDSKKPIFWQGTLLKCSKATGKGFWKKQYVVFQNQTLMLYPSQDDFTKGKKAHKYIAMGSIVPQLDHRSCQTANKKWPLVLDIPTGQGSKPGITVFAGDSQAVRRSFYDAISKYNFFRKSSMVLSILPCLYKNNYAKEQGIFRIAGESTKIQQLQQQIDDGNIPDFSQIISKASIHNHTGLLKRQLRFMTCPCIPETHYEAFIDIGRLANKEKRIEQLNFVIKSLSSTSVTVLAELCRFLNFAMQFESESKMGSVNFAIVIGPNILRTEADISNPMKALEDNKHMQTTISTMIVHYKQILPNLEALYGFDRATNPKWKYGVIDPPPSATSPRNAGPRGKSFGLFEISKSAIGGDGDGSGKGHAAVGSSEIPPPPPMVQRSGSVSIEQIQGASAGLKKTNAKKRNTAQPLQRKGSQQQDFRFILKKADSNSNKGAQAQAQAQPQQQGFHQHQIDFRSQMKVKKKSGLKPAEEDDVKASSPKLPPPNPIEVMSKEERQKQKDNTHILEIFQDFEDNMAQYDEEIDFKQSFAESIVSQIMELAENNQIHKAPQYAKQIENKCRMVINAAKAHSEALQTFNRVLNSYYSQMEEGDNEAHNKSGTGTPITAGGLTAGGPSFADDGKDSTDAIIRQNTYDKREIDTAGVNGGLPRFQKKDEEEKKVAKALFDYPGGYRSNELTFYRGTSLIITKEKEGWVYGYYELEPSLTGWFPKSYVKILSG